MILKEFDLDIPFVSGTKEEYEANWKEKRILFRDEVRCIASMAERYFSKYKFKTEKTWKILVNCYEDTKHIKKRLIPSEVYQVNIGFEINKYFDSDSEAKKSKYTMHFGKGLV